MSFILDTASAHPVAATAVTAVVGATALYNLGAFSDNRKFPPGPKPHPFVGHTFQTPATKIWMWFEELGKQYGPIIRLSLAGDELVVLNDPEDAEELLGRRSHNYSSRKPLVYAGRHQSRNKRLVLLPYGPALKTQRAAFHTMLQPRVVGGYEEMQERESTRLMHDMLTRPEEHRMNCNRFAASLVFYLSYGKRLGSDDGDLKAVLEILDGFIADCYPGAHLVDTFPILDNLPGFLAPWKAAASAKHVKEMELYQRLLNEVKEKMKTDKTFECFSARLWENNHKNKLDLTSMAYVAGSAFEAGTGTTSASIMWFLLAMVNYPETLKKAQAEIDLVCGSDGKTMPGFAHINDLPYCVALTKEIFRWMPSAPGGFPHHSDEDDEYKGYTIKGGTMVIPNIWAMQHNENAFPEPLRFNPDRFMREGDFTEHDSITEGHYAFGFGRRMCPGQHMGSKNVWIGLTRMMWGFDILPGLDADGKPIPLSPYNCTNGITCEPEVFDCRVIPRSAKHAETIMNEWVPI